VNKGWRLNIAIVERRERLAQEREKRTLARLNLERQMEYLEQQWKRRSHTVPVEAAKRWFGR